MRSRPAEIFITTKIYSQLSKCYHINQIYLYGLMPFIIIIIRQFFVTRAANHSGVNRLKGNAAKAGHRYLEDNVCQN